MQHARIDGVAVVRAGQSARGSGTLDASPHIKGLRKLIGEPRDVLRVNDTTARVLAGAEGHGIALLPSFVAAREPKWVKLLPRLVGPCREMWGVTHLDLRGNARVEACLSWLTRLARDAALEVRS